tara:strand:+ start:72 stop:356 length:285 start_codon:yes stop_codon:yes gene_type:complete
MNGKGDKPRFYPDNHYRNNYDKIFRGNKMKDIKGRQLKTGERVCIQEDIPTINGVLYKNSICKIEAFNSEKVQVQDRSGKLWWVASNQVSCSFL